jgi:hypothetical protein
MGMVGAAAEQGVEATKCGHVVLQDAPRGPFEYPSADASSLSHTSQLNAARPHIMRRNG